MTKFAAAHGQSTAARNDLDWSTSSLSANSKSCPDAKEILIDSSHLKQRTLGFGGAFTEAMHVALDRLGPEAREEALRTYFDPQEGLGYQLCRTHINSCDFSLENYDYGSLPEDHSLKDFGISRDQGSLIPLIRDAQEIAGRPLDLLASPWSPPAWMKTSGKMNGFGKLRRDCYDTWALYIVRYLQAYREEGIDIQFLTPQNEAMAASPWDACHYSPAEMALFIKTLRRTLDAHGWGTLRIVAYDHNKALMPLYMNAVFSDLEAQDAVWGIGYHWYDESDSLANVNTTSLRQMGRLYPDKPLLLTEACNTLWDNRPKGSRLRGLRGTWWSGEKYARHIIADFNAGSTAWIDWNMVLDEDGGPNHNSNHCHAPIIADADSGQLSYESPYYVIGHFSRNIRPGARIVHSQAKDSGLAMLAAQNPDGDLACVLLNEKESDIPYCLRDEASGNELSATAPSRSVSSWLLTLAESLTPIRTEPRETLAEA